MSSYTRLSRFRSEFGCRCIVRAAACTEPSCCRKLLERRHEAGARRSVVCLQRLDQLGQQRREDGLRDLVDEMRVVRPLRRPRGSGRAGRRPALPPSAARRRSGAATAVAKSARGRTPPRGRTRPRGASSSVGHILGRRSAARAQSGSSPSRCGVVLSIRSRSTDMSRRQIDATRWSDREPGRRPRRRAPPRATPDGGGRRRGAVPFFCPPDQFIFGGVDHFNSTNSPVCLFFFTLSH